MARGAPLQLAFWCALACLWAGPARAGGRVPLRLLPQAALDVPCPTQPSPWLETPLVRQQLLFGAGTELVADAVLLAGGTWLGHSTGSLPLAVLPTVLFLALPPLATTFVATRVAADSQRVQVRFLWAALASAGVHVGASVVAILLGVNTNQLGGLIAFGLVDVVLTTGASVAVMDLLATPRPSDPSTATKPSASPAASPVAADGPLAMDHRVVVPVFSAHF
jgi:hypothetical protein